MGLSIKGYVLDPPRVGGSNSPYTMTPDNYVYDPTAFSVAYPLNESAPRTEYHVFVVVDPKSAPTKTGPGGNGSFVDARFGWTKNEVLPRFEYDGSENRFKTLPGSALIVVGLISSDSNTNRLKVLPPVSSNISSYPIRVSVGTGSGQAFTVSLVLADVDFTVPLAGMVQLSLSTGNLNWNPSDLVTYSGQTVRFQRQTFYAYRDSTGALGAIESVLLLNPLPGAGQYPLVRIGFGEYLTPVERATEAAFLPNPASGTVEWARNTGRLKFNSTDTSNNPGRIVHYEGVAFGWGLSLTPISVGTLTSPGVLSPLPSEDSDTFFRVSGTVQFAQTQYVDTLTSPKKGVVQIRRSDGQVRFSVDDLNKYGAATAQAITADLVIERGVKIRLFRTPVNLDDADGTLQDVSAFYASSNATWANPIIATPTVDLPAVPVDTRTLTVKVTQGTGTYTSDNLPRLDVASPPTGIGYVLDYETKQLHYAQRKANLVIPALSPYGGVQLPDPLVYAANLSLAVQTTPGGSYASLVVGTDVLVDLPSGLVTMVATEGVEVTSNTGASFSGTTFTDTLNNFVAAGVQQGHRLVVPTGLPKGVYSVATVGTTTLTTDVPGVTSSGLEYSVRNGVEILADRYFYEVPQLDPNTSVERITPLGTIANSPRLSVPLSYIGSVRFRFGKTTFSVSVTPVANDGSFTAPAVLSAGAVEVSQTTGNLNFSQVDVTAGGLVYAVRLLVLGADYSVQSALGFIQLSESLLALEEALVSYKNSSGVVVQERATFLVRKEKPTHPVATSTINFNPLGREVALTPSPKVYRGGRPQSSLQVQITSSPPVITFVEAPTVTDALPSGPIVAPSENIYIDYYLYEAVGGEQNFTVLQPPMQGVSIYLSADANDFYIAGDRTAIFGANTLLLVNGSELYSVGSSTYDSGNQRTQVVLDSPQVFVSDQNNPKLSISSGPVRVVGTPVLPSYFVTDLTSYSPIAKGSSVIHFEGDVSRTYRGGVVLLFSDTGYTDYYLVTGSTYNSDTGQTDVTLTTESYRQYVGIAVKRALRPVLMTPSGAMMTSKSPELSQPLTLYRRVEGAVGTILTAPEDYTIDASGSVTLANPLTLNEEVGIFYTGDVIIEAGRSFRASYTFDIVPSESNGLLGQNLKADYTAYSPDTFYWRVETFTNFRGELADSYAAAASSSVPSGGPILTNSPQPRLFEQGKPSLYYDEGYLANEDLVAIPTLKYFNDAINSLEDVLQNMDGRVVGDHDGRFKFDGSVTNPYRTTFASVTNQIDDVFKVSPAPYTVSGPPFVLTSVGTYIPVYKAAATSRFYPTYRNKYGVTADPSGLSVGDPLMDMGVTHLTSVKGVQRRVPWAMVTAKALTGDTTLYVDNALGSTDLLRPAFTTGMKVAIIAQNGTVLVPDSSSLTLGTVSSTNVVIGALPVDIPKGATVRLATDDTTYAKSYRLGIDLSSDFEKGLLTYLDPANPVWALLTPSVPATGEVLDTPVSLNNLLTTPDRFPALDGGTTDDDGNRQFPILTPSILSEVSTVGCVAEELSIVNSSTGTLVAATTPSFVGVGNLDLSGLVITNTGGAWTSPIPQDYDIVDIRSGPNAVSLAFRTVVSVGADSITVSPAFLYPGDTGFTFTLTSCSNLESGTATVNPTTHIQDLSADYIYSGVQPGHTVIITSGGMAGLRRQVVEVLDANNLTVEAFTSTGSFTYRVVNSLATYGRAPNSITESSWIPELSRLLSVLYSGGSIPSEQSALEAFFNTAFSTIVTGVNGVSNWSILSSSGSTFISSGVTTSTILYIRTGSAAGLYKIQSVDTETSLTIDGVFPVNTTGITFKLCSTVGLTVEGMQGIFGALQSVDDFFNSTALYYFIFYPIFGPSVSNDPGAYVTRLLGSDLTTRESQLTSRISQVTTDITSIVNELTSADKLYDKRYTWIDSRINLTNGILAKRELAVANRIKAQQEMLNQLIKMLSVQ